MVDGEGNLLSSARKMLVVRQGSRGLAQNEAVFQHLLNLPVVMAELTGTGEKPVLQGVAASTGPRPVKGSYMPVFRVAESFGRSLAGLFEVPFIETSHQEGHLAAGLWSAGGPADNEFLALHVSGGTTEILRVSRGSAVESTVHTFETEILGGTTDLHAGQFIDRSGVQLGLPFPAGPDLEIMARESSPGVIIPSSVKLTGIPYEMSFSGPEAAVSRLVAGRKAAADIARAVEECVARTLLKVITKAVSDTGLRSVLLVGGVLANAHIKKYLAAKLQQQAFGVRLYFASSQLSGDNAVGVALIGMSRLRGGGL